MLKEILPARVKALSVLGRFNVIVAIPSLILTVKSDILKMIQVVAQEFRE